MEVHQAMLDCWDEAECYQLFAGFRRHPAASRFTSTLNLIATSVYSLPTSTETDSLDQLSD
jgi:hypothetical protein